MRNTEAQRLLSKWDRANRTVYLKRDLAKVFGDQTEATLNATIQRLISEGVLMRVARDTYVYADSARLGPATIQEIALALRRGKHVFESLESAAAQWGIISQVPINRTTLMTTGRTGEFHTPFGTIDFVHTKASPEEISANTIVRDNLPIPLAKYNYVLKNLKRTGRSRELVNEAARKDESWEALP